MSELEALGIFLAASLSIRRERYISLANKETTRGKFLNALNHDLEKDLGRRGMVMQLPDEILDSPGFLFGSFGKHVITVREIVDSHLDAFLIVSNNGLAGTYGPETFIDSRVHFDFSKRI